MVKPIANPRNKQNRRQKLKNGLLMSFRMVSNGLLKAKTAIVKNKRKVFSSAEKSITGLLTSNNVGPKKP